MTLFNQLMILCPLIFLAGFVDSIAGGGGLISLPAHYMAGLPPHIAMGTNKFGACIGTAVSTSQYIRLGYVKRSLIIISVVAALTGSFIGAKCALFLSEMTLKIIMMALIPLITVLTLIKKDFLAPSGNPPEGIRSQALTGICALLIGWYDGFFGPGTGIFLMLCFIGIVGLDVVTACGNAKVINLASNLAAVIAFIANGKVIYALAIPCACCSMLGNFLGSRLAIKNGAKIIRPVMLVVIALLFVTIGKDVLASLMQLL